MMMEISSRCLSLSRKTAKEPKVMARKMTSGLNIHKVGCPTHERFGGRMARAGGTKNRKKAVSKLSKKLSRGRSRWVMPHTIWRVRRTKVRSGAELIWYDGSASVPRTETFRTSPITTCSSYLRSWKRREKPFLPSMKKQTERANEKQRNASNFLTENSQRCRRYRQFDIVCSCAAGRWRAPRRSSGIYCRRNMKRLKTNRTRLKKNFLKKIFGYKARCDFWSKLGLRFWIFVG